jgi:N-acetylneuraminate synthase
MQAAKEIVGLEPQMIKVPSPRNDWYDMIDYLCAEFGGELHVSLGMLTHAEIDILVRRLMGNGRLADTVLYSCTSGYPVTFEDAAIEEIDWLKRRYGTLTKGIGCSLHTLGIALDVAVAAKGVTHIERHFTLNRAWKGTDHSASLEPDGIRRVMRDTAAVVEALHMKPEELAECEREMAEKLRVSI